MLHKIEVILKLLIKRIASLLPVNAFQRPLAFSVIYNEFRDLQTTPKFESREELWAEALRVGCSNQAKDPISYVEFGVLEGYSIKWFSSNNTHINSTFVGLDSFVGLPSDWDGIPAGTLNVGGVIPTTKDNRVAFLKGWFWDTSSVLLRHLKKSNSLIVNFDADLYSSTLYALTEIDQLKKSYIAIFDEFAGHESRALYNYAQSHGAKVTFLGRVMFNYEPWCVLCKIEPYKPTGSSGNIYGRLSI